MVFTNSQARGQWCPFSRVPAEEVRQASGYPAPGGPSINRSRSAFPTSTACLGERCMAWRWTGPMPPGLFRRADDDHAVDEPPRPEIGVPASWVWEPYDGDGEGGAAGWREPDDEAAARRRGYCGMAGPLRDISQDLAELPALVREIGDQLDRR